MITENISGSEFAKKELLHGTRYGKSKKDFEWMIFYLFTALVTVTKMVTTNWDKKMEPRMFAGFLRER